MKRIWLICGIVLVAALSAVAVDTIIGGSVLKLRAPGAISLQPNGDTDNFLSFTTESNIPYIDLEGTNSLYIRTDEPSISQRFIPSEGGFAGFGMYPGGGSENWTLLYMGYDSRPGFAFRVDDTTNDAQVIPFADNAYNLGANSYRWADVKSVLINGADVCFENNICMTECVNDDGQIDLCFVYGKPTEDQVKSISLAPIETYQEYVDRHTEDDVFDGSMSEQEYDARRGNITVDGKIDLTLGRTSHGSIREIKAALISQNQRLNHIEATLCDQGITSYC